jgi:hypothetical protein
MCFERELAVAPLVICERSKRMTESHSMMSTPMWRDEKICLQLLRIGALICGQSPPPKKNLTYSIGKIDPHWFEGRRNWSTLWNLLLVSGCYFRYQSKGYRSTSVHPVIPGVSPGLPISFPPFFGTLSINFCTKTLVSDVEGRLNYSLYVSTATD